MSQNSVLDQHRPLHTPAKNLQQKEAQCLNEILGNKRVSLATAVAQILHGSNDRWTKQACGVLCFVKDYEQRLYYLRLYNLQSRKMIYEQSVPASIRLEKSLDLFYTFDGANCKVGINFVDRDEAQTFAHHFQTKQEDRRAKRETRGATKGNPAPTMSTISNIAQSPVLSKSQEVQKKNSISKGTKFFTLGRSSKGHARPEISLPVTGSMHHQIHIGPTNSFVNDDTQRKLFEEVLSSMNISPADAKLVRKMIKRNQIDYGKLVPSGGGNTPREQQQSGPSTTSSNHQGAATGGNKRTRGPHQDIAVPSITRVPLSKNPSQLPTTPISAANLNQPSVSPRPTPPPPPPTDIPSAPPIAPPLPPDLISSPPMAPPLPVNFSSSSATPNQSSLGNPKTEPPTPETPKKQPLPSGQPTGWLNDIVSFNPKEGLKPVADQPRQQKEVPKSGSNAEPKRSMEDNIREMIEIRRLALMGAGGEEEESSSSESGFSD